VLVRPELDLRRQAQLGHRPEADRLGVLPGEHRLAPDLLRGVQPFPVGAGAHGLEAAGRRPIAPA
jgi:hypothetical protein